MATDKKAASPPAAKPKKTPVKKVSKINRVGILLDASGSMSHLEHAVRERIRALIKGIHLATPVGQQAQFSVFTFAEPGSFKTLFLNATFNPELVKQSVLQYRAVGPATALLDSMGDAIASMDISTKEGSDITKLLYVITDGQDNASKNYGSDHNWTSGLKPSFSNVIRELDDLWTLGVLVPSEGGRSLMKAFGIPDGNIEVWNPTTVKGLESATSSITRSYSEYSSVRSAGLNNTSNLFRPSTSTLSKTEVKKNLDRVEGSVFFAQKDYRIDEFVEKNTGASYVRGSSFYELTKSELVQPYKEVVLVDKTSGEKFGGSEARDLIGISSTNQRVSIGNHGRWHVFIQSTSLNRKIPSGTRVFVKGV